MVFIRSYFLQTVMYINLFTRKCFYEKKSKMRGNLDTLLQLSTSGEEVVWFHGAVLRRKKKNRNLTASKMRSSGILSKYCQKQYQFLPKVFHFKWIGMILWKIRKNIFYSNSFAYKMIVALQLLVNL